jgi:hypothetical protein
VVSAGPDGTPVAVYTHGDTGEALTETVRLVDVAGNTIASVQGESGHWAHLKVDRVTDTLQLSLIDEDVVRDGVEEGVVAGFLITTTHEPGEDRVRVTASDAELSDYFETNPDSFAPPSLVWHKAGGSPSTADYSAPLVQNWRLPSLVVIGLVALASPGWLWRKGRA